MRVQRLIADLLCPWFFVQAAGAAGSRCSSTGQQQQIHDEPAALAHNWWESRREIGGAGCGRTAMAAIRPPPRVVQTTGSGSQQREVEWEVGRELGKVRRAATAARSLLGRPCHARGCAVLLCRGLLARRVLTALAAVQTVNAAYFNVQTFPDQPRENSVTLPYQSPTYIVLRFCAYRLRRMRNAYLMCNVWYHLPVLIHLDLKTEERSHIHTQHHQTSMHL